MDNIVTQDTAEDSVKRVKILFLAFAISSSLFFTKVLAQEESVLKIYVVGGIYFLVAFIGLLWAFNFKIKFKSLIYILQGSLFVLSEVLFVLLFFFQQFNRIYEGLLLVVLLIFIGLITYSCFLMVNVFNVALFKNLPLIQVAQTASYILTLLMIYFFTFSILASEFPVYVIFPAILISYIFIWYMQFNELRVEKDLILRRVTLLTLINIFSIIPLLFVSSNHEIISVVPTIGGFAGSGLLNLSNQQNIKWQIAGYNFLIALTMCLVVYFTWF